MLLRTEWLAGGLRMFMLLRTGRLAGGLRMFMLLRTEWLRGAGNCAIGHARSAGVIGVAGAPPQTPFAP
ncbi:hypothetical protein AB0C89_15870 [Streptomyces sp. NPDC048491]|uniref:hypothetical protein n=1 Tax=Streptomyces sp. NPDC048491 TaxID=3157207 RepID=UPI0034301F68